jgi:methionine-rich copper-binding protein CopC
MNTSTDSKKILGGIAALLIATFVMLTGGAGNAQAHTTVKSVKASSKVLRITFSEPIRRGTVRATNSRGKVISKGKGARDPRSANRLKVTLKKARKGSYTAAWTIVAADGHSQSGTVGFRVK